MGILFTKLIASKNKKKNTGVKRGFFWIRIVMTSNYLTDWYPEENNLEDCCGKQPLRAERWKLRFHTWFSYMLLLLRVWRLWPKEALVSSVPSFSLIFMAWSDGTTFTYVPFVERLRINRNPCCGNIVDMSLNEWSILRN